MTKTIQFCAALVLISISQSSLAMAPFGDESCRLVSRQGVDALNLYADTSQNQLIVRDRFENYDLDALYVGRKAAEQDKPTGQEDLIVKVLNDSTKKKTNFVDGCNQGETGTFIRHAQVSQVSPKAADLLKFSKGQQLTLECRYQGIEMKDDCSSF